MTAKPRLQGRANQVPRFQSAALLLLMTFILQTPRLVLRKLNLDDMDFVAEMLAHPEVMRFWPRPHTRDEAADWIRRQQNRYVRDGYGYWLAPDKVNGQPIGQAGLAHILFATANPDILRTSLFS